MVNLVKKNCQQYLQRKKMFSLAATQKELIDLFARFRFI